MGLQPTDLIRGADTADAAVFLVGDGPREVARISREAEGKGVFGVPSFMLDDELFWGSEHLFDICEVLAFCSLESAR